MSVSDPIADMLTRVRNAHMAGLDSAEMPHSKLKEEIAKVLKKEGYISDYVAEEAPRKTLRIHLKYVGDREPAIRKLRMVSRQGLRRYAGHGDMPRVLGGLGISIVTTSEGVMTGKEARKRRAGGEILCEVW
ncbi:MAG: 30S ribosomal protein S8 [Kiritimatiellia bacterium]